MKKVLGYFLSVTSAFFLIIVLLFTAVDAVAFRSFKVYEELYAKNDVYSYVEIDEEGLNHVTSHFLDYLLDKEEDLVVYAQIGGETMEFFNQREKEHMVDVKDLVLDGINLRRILIVYICVAIALVKLLGFNFKTMLSWSIGVIFPIVIAIAMGLGAIISKDFTGAFVKFHELLFTNDLWILDSATSRLINIVPEPFFEEIAIRIAVIFAVYIFMVCLIAWKWKMADKIAKTKEI